MQVVYVQSYNNKNIGVQSSEKHKEISMYLTYYEKIDEDNYCTIN